MARTVAVTIAVAWLVAGATVWAQPSGSRSPEIDLDVLAPPGCPPEEVLRAQIDELAERDEGSRSRLAALIEMWRGEDGIWHARVQTRSRAHAGDRSFRGASCEEVASAAAALLALAWDVAGPMASEPEPVAVLERSAIPYVATVPSPAAPPAVPADSTRPHAHRVFARAVGGADLGALPGVTPAVGVGVGAEKSSFRVDVGVVLWGASEARLDGEVGVGAALDFWAVRARACRRGWGFGLCAGGEWGTMTGRSFGVRMPETDTGTWLAATAELVRSWPVWDRIELVAEVGAVIPVVSPQFLVQGEPLYTPAQVSGRGRLGVQVRFP